MKLSYRYCCMFTYDPYRDPEVPCTAIGVMNSWPSLCIECDRQGSSCPAKRAVHFKMISPRGPQLFAVSLDTLKVFYHDEGQWHQYQSARNVQLGTLEELMVFFNNDNDNNNANLSRGW
ncbi:unnamed protein product [Rotaria sp. Silwood2]|nr:unnamed protein product [Rotaria sp. Silwood2]CAF4304467.1 unnamed protein product [Rotaria sp. Silwood2]